MATRNSTVGRACHFAERKRIIGTHHNLVDPDGRHETTQRIHTVYDRVGVEFPQVVLRGVLRCRGAQIRTTVVPMLDPSDRERKRPTTGTTALTRRQSADITLADEWNRFRSLVTMPERLNSGYLPWTKSIGSGIQVFATLFSGFLNACVRLA